MLSDTKESEVDPFNDGYFPEYQLTCWFKDVEKLDVPIYTFDRCGVIPMKRSYEELVKELKIDAIILADGGMLL